MTLSPSPICVVGKPCDPMNLVFDQLILSPIKFKKMKCESGLYALVLSEFYKFLIWMRYVDFLWFIAAVI